MNKEELVNSFIKNTTLEDEFTDQGDHKKVNETYWKIIKIIKAINDIDPKFDSLEHLLKHKNDSVKTWTAAIMLFTEKKDKAAKFLKKLGKKKGFVALDAMMTLKEWKAGRLKPLINIEQKSS